MNPRVKNRIAARAAQWPRFRRLMRSMFEKTGWRTLAHVLRRRLLSDSVVVTDDFDGDLRFACHLGEHIGSFMFWRGAYSWNQLQVLDRLLEPHMVLFDVGANQGEFSLFAAKRATRGHVYAFEPMTEMFERFQRNVALNGFANITARRIALASEAGRRRLYRSGGRFADGTVHEGLGTMFPTAKRDQFVEEVECMTLDAVVRRDGIERIDVIKIDVEGAELAVLRGAEGTLERMQPIVFLEVDTRCAAAAGVAVGDVLAFLDPWYEFHVVRPNGTTRALDRARLRAHQDVVCLPK